MAGTLLFSRLLLYITWDQLSLVSAKESVQVNQVKSTTFMCLFPHPFNVQDGLFVLWSYLSHLLLFFFNLLKKLLLRFFGTTEVSLSMDELMGRRLLCGNGTGAQLVGRVKIDFACLQVQKPFQGGFKLLIPSDLTTGEGR